MRHIALAAIAAAVLALFVAFTVTDSPRPGVAAPHRTLCAEAAAVGDGLPPTAMAGGNSGLPFQAVAYRTAGDLGPRGWLSDLIRRVRRLLRAVRDAIDDVLDHTNGGKDDPGSTIGIGGLQRAEMVTPEWPIAAA